MIITCPCEKKQFKIDSSLIPQKGRELQCGSCERVWFFKPKNESKVRLTLNENISVNKIEPVIETNDINLEFSKKLQKEKIIEPEIKKEISKEIPKTVKKLENKGYKFFSNLIVLIISLVALNHHSLTLFIIAPLYGILVIGLSNALSLSVANISN